MLFNAVTIQSNLIENYSISGNSWSECLAYLEGTGKTIKSITLTQIPVYVNNPTIGYSYSFTLRNESTSTSMSVEMFDSYDNVISWINNQTGYTLLQLGRIDKNFISI